MKLTDTQIAGYAVMAGFPSSVIRVVVAVALAESGGDSAATNNNSNGSTDSGLMQINSIHRNSFPVDYPLRFNPINNMRMAKKIYADAGNSFRPWVAYTSGAYAKFLTRGGAVAGTTAGTVRGLTNGAGGGVDGSFDANTSEQEFWSSIGAVVGKQVPEEISSVGAGAGQYRTMRDGTTITQWYPKDTLWKQRMNHLDADDYLLSWAEWGDDNIIKSIVVSKDNAASSPGVAVDDAIASGFPDIPSSMLWIGGGTILVVLGILMIAKPI